MLSYQGTWGVMHKAGEDISFSLYLLSHEIVLKAHSSLQLLKENSQSGGFIMQLFYANELILFLHAHKAFYLCFLDHLCSTQLVAHQTDLVACDDNLITH